MIFSDHMRRMLTRNQREAYRMFCTKQARRGLPVVCWGMYRWLAPQNTEARRREFLAWRKATPPEHRVRPVWCSRTMWDSFRKFQREVRADMTIEEYRDRRMGALEKPTKYISRPRVGSVLERSPEEILAKFARLGLLPKKVA